MASVDVVVPCYNYAHYLEACVASVLAQTGVDVRVLIVDDCSPDNTPEVAARLAAADARVTYVRNPRNLRLIGTMNRGALEWATADYTMALSADDALAPGALACLAGALDRHPEAHMAYGIAQIFRDAIPASAATPTPATMTCQLIGQDDFLVRCCTAGNPAPSPTTLVRTDTQKRTGGYNAQFRHTSDMEMWMRLATFGPVAVVKETMGYYRWHGANMSSELGDVWTDFRERLATCEYVYKTWNGRRFAPFTRAVREIRDLMLEDILKRAVIAMHEETWPVYDQYVAFASELRPLWKWTPNGLRLRARRAIGWRRYTARGDRWTTLKFPKPRVAPPNADWRDGNSDLFGWWPQAGELTNT